MREIKDTTVYNENMIALKPETKVFLMIVGDDGFSDAIEKRKQAIKYAKERRSYLGTAYNDVQNMVGWYVPD